jgi:parvulin-like peptidyl-prolyl isomerase
MENWRPGQEEVPVSPPAETGPPEPVKPSPQTQPRQSSAAGPRASSATSRPSAHGKVIGEQEIVAASLVQVNSRFFSVDDILRAAGPELARLPGNLPPLLLRQRVAEVIKSTIREQVGQSLVLEQADKRMSDEVKERIESKVQDRLREMIAEAGGSRKVLESKLESEGTTLEQAIESYRDALKVESYLREKLTRTVTVNRRVLLDYYRSHPDEFISPKKVQMQIIAAPVKEFLSKGAAGTKASLASARLPAREQIDKAAAALRGGRDFGDVARSFSKGFKAAEGGLWPTMPSGSFRSAEVERAAFALKEGQVSDIIETEAGFFIVKAKCIVEQKVTSFEEAQAGIEERLGDEQYSRLARKYFDELYAGATITPSDELLYLAVDRATAKYILR